MILTKDNLLRFVREKKYVTPTTVGESFETSTMIASAALSELAKDKLISITHLKLSSSPYYYDPKQKSSLAELGEKHFKNYDRDIFLKLQENQILNSNSLSIQENLAVDRIKDFAIPLEIISRGKEMKFWVWFMRDIVETRKQIVEALEGNYENSEPKSSPQKTNHIPKKQESEQSISREFEKPVLHQSTYSTNSFEDTFSSASSFSPSKNISNRESTASVLEKMSSSSSSSEKQNVKTKDQQEFDAEIDDFIDKFFKKNHLRMINKQKDEKGTFYNTSLQLNNIEIIFDCFFFNKKPSDPDIIKFYASSQNPKIVFIQNPAKRLFKMAENLENLTIVNI
ncbi:MAG: hypothetical protein KC589_04345 [Nanoarchaeota archaeon]|nr:hypothetical protein [Nanoarchaeota archaeon]